MTVTVQSLLDDIAGEGAFDATQAQALRWLDRRHKQMCARSLCVRSMYSPTSIAPSGANLTLGVSTTEADMTGLPGVVELYEVTVIQGDGSSLIYVPTRHADLVEYLNGTLRWDGSYGLVVAEREGGTDHFTLIPGVDASTFAGQVRVYGAFEAQALTADGVVQVDDDAVEGLLAGVFATALSRPQEARLDLASGYEEQFAAECEALRLRTARRFKGRGPRQIRLSPGLAS